MPAFRENFDHIGTKWNWKYKKKRNLYHRFSYWSLTFDNFWNFFFLLDMRDIIILSRGKSQGTRQVNFWETSYETDPVFTVRWRGRFSPDEFIIHNIFHHFLLMLKLNWTETALSTITFFYNKTLMSKNDKKKDISKSKYHTEASNFTLAISLQMRHHKQQHTYTESV